MGDFKHGKYFTAIKDAGTVWTEIGAALTTCKGMSTDVAEIEAWAKIFTHPTTLAATVGKNWLFHGSAIRKDIS